MKYIDRDLMKEMKDKYSYFVSRDLSEIRLRADKLERKALEKMSQIHSFKIENPFTRVPYCVPKNNARQSIKKGIKNLRKAFLWGCNNFDPEEFDESFIRSVAGKITPQLYAGPFAEYRDSGVTVAGASTTPPYPEKVMRKEIPFFERELKRKLTSKDDFNQLESAIFSHFHIARIHPFKDGNGRTARVCQDVILSHFLFPVPIIMAGEREIYYHFLDKAIVDWKDQNNWEKKDLVTEGEHLFYTFIASKVNISLDKILSLEIN